MRKILLLGGSAQQIIAIETAKRMGLYTVLCDYLPDNPGQYYSDKFYLVSTTDIEAVLDVAIKEAIDGVIAYASDPAAPTAAYVAEKMGLPTNPYSAVNTLCNKGLFRSFLKNHGFNTPKSESYDSKENALAGIGYFRFPIIIKPVDSSGSKGVTVLQNSGGIANAIDFAFSYSRGNKIIIEEFVEKKHPYLIGGDIFVSNGKVVLWGLMNCHRDLEVNSLVPVGKSYPLLLEDSDLCAVKKTLQRLVTELEVKFGPMNVELVIDKNNQVFPIDIGPRSGGNMIPDLLGMIFNCDIVEMAIRASIGEEITKVFYDGTPFYATLNLHVDKNGLFDYIEYSSNIEKYIVKKCIYVKKGDKVKYFSNSADALGIVFFKFPSEEMMNYYLSSVKKHIKIVLKDI